MSTTRPHAGSMQSDDYYNAVLNMYAAVWGGTNDRMCWGFFDSESTSLQEAGDRHIARMAATECLTPSSVVLDVGCGKGTTAIQLAKTFGCAVVGIDPVMAHIDVATAKAAAEGAGTGSATFLCGTLETLDGVLAPGSFTHVWSNGTFYHIPVEARGAAVALCSKLLAPGGRLVMDDAFGHPGKVSEEMQKCILDRLHFDRPFTLPEYKTHLAAAGFTRVTIEDISSHMEKTYRTTTAHATEAGYNELAAEHTGTADVIARGEFGWAVFRGFKSS